MSVCWTSCAAEIMASADAASTSNRSQSAVRALPVEMNILKSYFTWIEELAKDIEKTAFSKADSLVNYIKLILEGDKVVKAGKYDVEVGNDGDENEMNASHNDSVSVGYIAFKLSVAAMYAYVGDYASGKAFLNFEKCYQNLLMEIDLSSDRRDIIVYFWDTLVWSIDVLEAKEKTRYGIPTSYLSLLQEESLTLNSRFKTLHNKYPNLVTAASTFLKGRLSAAMKTPEKITLKIWMKAIDEDPDCYVWSHYAYRSYRRIRRTLNRRPNGLLNSPSDEERQLAKTAYDLSTNEIVPITDYALLLKDILWTEKESFWQAHENDYLKCVQLFEEALVLANEHQNQKWIRKIQVYLAELLVFGKGKKLDYEKGKRMLDECVEKYPSSTVVHHKAAKLYHYGTRFVKDCIDLDRAKGYYKQAMEFNPDNYPCIMDYIKLLQSRQEYSEVIDVVGRMLEVTKKDYQAARLHVVKGYVTWVWNPKNLSNHRAVAIESWMFVFKNLPMFSDEVYNSMPIYLGREHPEYVVKSEIRLHLETEGKQYCSDKEEAALVINFIQGLSKTIDQRKHDVDLSMERKSEGNEKLTDNLKRLGISSRTNTQRFRNVSESSLVDNKTGNDSSQSRSQWRRSEADEDDNWRIRK